MTSEQLMAPWEDPRVTAGLDQQKQLRASMLARGATAIGWKVGFGAPSALELMQITEPLLGFLTNETVSESGAEVDRSRWQNAFIEFEVAVYMGADLGAGATNSEAEAAVAAVGAAFELADIDSPVTPENVEGVVGGNIFHKSVILGEPDRGRAGLDISALSAHIRHRDGTTGSVVDLPPVSDLQANTGNYARIVSTVASTLDSIGLELRAGDVIITGSVVPPLALSGPGTFTFTLDPFEPISINVV